MDNIGKLSIKSAKNTYYFTDILAEFIDNESQIILQEKITSQISYQLCKIYCSDNTEFYLQTLIFKTENPEKIAYFKLNFEKFKSSIETHINIQKISKYCFVESKNMLILEILYENTGIKISEFMKSQKYTNDAINSVLLQLANVLNYTTNINLSNNSQICANTVKIKNGILKMLLVFNKPNTELLKICDMQEKKNVYNWAIFVLHECCENFDKSLFLSEFKDKLEYEKFLDNLRKSDLHFSENIKNIIIQSLNLTENERPNFMNIISTFKTEFDNAKKQIEIKAEITEKSNENTNEECIIQVNMKPIKLHSKQMLCIFYKRALKSNAKIG